MQIIYTRKRVTTNRLNSDAITIHDAYFNVFFVHIQEYTLLYYYTIKCLNLK